MTASTPRSNVFDRARQCIDAAELWIERAANVFDDVETWMDRVPEHH